MNTTSNRFTTALTAALLLAVLPFGLAACSSGNGDTSDAPTAGTAQGIGAKWSACMRDGGFEVPDASDDEVSSGVSRVPNGVDQERFTERSASCSEELGIERSSEAEQQKWTRQYDAVAACIREDGYADFPEQKAGSLDFQSYARSSEPQFDEVAQKCLAEHAPDTQRMG